MHGKNLEPQCSVDGIGHNACLLHNGENYEDEHQEEGVKRPKVGERLIKEATEIELKLPNKIEILQVIEMTKII